MEERVKNCRSRVNMMDAERCSRMQDTVAEGVWEEVLRGWGCPVRETFLPLVDIRRPISATSTASGAQLSRIASWFILGRSSRQAAGGRRVF